MEQEEKVGKMRKGKGEECRKEEERKRRRM